MSALPVSQQGCSSAAVGDGILPENAKWFFSGREGAQEGAWLICYSFQKQKNVF